MVQPHITTPASTQARPHLTSPQVTREVQRELPPLLARLVLGAALIFSVALYLSSRLEAAMIRDAQGSVRGAADEVLFVTDSTTVRLLSLGYNQAAADIIWLRSIQYFASHMLTDRRYPWLEHFVHQIIQLDPRFRQIYIWAGSCILYGGEITPERVHASNRVYKAALKMFPNDYEPLYRLGMNYYSELQVDDPKERARYRELGLTYFERAARMPNAPPSVLQLIRGIAKSMSRDDILLYALNDELARTDDPTIRSRIQARIERVSDRLQAAGAQGGATEHTSALVTSLITPETRAIQARLYQEQQRQGRAYLNLLDYELIFGAPQSTATSQSTTKAKVVSLPFSWRALIKPELER